MTRDRAGELDTTLTQLARLPERPPILVVDNASTDGTAGMVASRHPDVTLIQAARNLGAAGRNVGVRRAPTTYVAFSDDDSWWEPGALQRAAAAFDANPTLGLVAARILVGRDERTDPTSLAMARSPLPADPTLPGVPVLGFLACGAVVRRSAFLDVGGFEPRLEMGGEEHLLALDLARRGYRLRYLDEVVAHHHPSTHRDTGERRRQLTRNAVWTAWLRRPPSVAGRVTLRAIARSRHDEHAAAGLRQSLAGLGWVLREREVVDPTVEDSLRTLGL